MKKAAANAALVMWMERSAVAAILNNILGVAGFFLQLAFGLLGEPLGLLLAAADDVAHFFLDLAADVFGLAFDLVFVHKHTSTWLRLPPYGCTIARSVRYLTKRQCRCATIMLPACLRERACATGWPASAAVPAAAPAAGSNGRGTGNPRLPCNGASCRDRDNCRSARRSSPLRCGPAGSS